MSYLPDQGRIQGGDTRNTPKISAPPSAIGKNSHEIPKKKLRLPSQLEKL